MGLDPVTVTLTPFEKLEILRTELKAREEEMQSVERDLRRAMRTLATHRYLRSVSEFYASQPPPPEAATAPELDKRRQALYQLIQALRAEIPRLESAAVRGQPPPRAAGRVGRFDLSGPGPGRRGG
jgi:hypothetical protein